MRAYARLSLIAMLSFAVTGCVIIDGEVADRHDWRAEQRDNREMISQLEMGMDRGAVMTRLGTPSDSEAFDRDGAEFRVLFYRTQHRHSDGDTTRDETTPLVFENDLLIGWGHSVYAELRPWSVTE